MARPDSSYPPEQNFNPYTSPEAELGRLPESSRLAPVEFSIGDVLSRAWTVYQERMGFCIGALAVGFAAIVASMIPVGIILTVLGTVIPDPIVIGITFFVLWLGVYFFAIYVQIGQWLTYLRVAKGEPVTMGEVFAGGPYLLKTILGGLVVGLAAMGIAILGSIPGGIATVIFGSNAMATKLVTGLSAFVAYIAVLVFYVAVSQFFFVILDRPSLGAIESLKYSVQITKGHRWGIVGLFLIAGLINIAGAILLLIGLIFTVPFSFLILATAYTALAPGSPTSKPVPKSSFLMD